MFNVNTAALDRFFHSFFASKIDFVWICNEVYNAQKNELKCLCKYGSFSKSSLMTKSMAK